MHNKLSILQQSCALTSLCNSSRTPYSSNISTTEALPLPAAISRADLPYWNKNDTKSVYIRQNDSSQYILNSSRNSIRNSSRKMNLPVDSLDLPLPPARYCVQYGDLPLHKPRGTVSPWWEGSSDRAIDNRDCTQNQVIFGSLGIDTVETSLQGVRSHDSQSRLCCLTNIKVISGTHRCFRCNPKIRHGSTKYMYSSATNLISLSPLVMFTTTLLTTS